MSTETAKSSRSQSGWSSSRLYDGVGGSVLKQGKMQEQLGFGSHALVVKHEQYILKVPGRLKEREATPQSQAQVLLTGPAYPLLAVCPYGAQILAAEITS